MAVMHDFFVDRLVHPQSVGALLAAVEAKARSGGGGIHGIGQSDVKGGNAVNLALALATLGARTLLITHSDEEHLALLRLPFEGLPAEVRVKPLQAGLTVAIEGDVNVMLGEAGGAGHFGPSLLDGEDWRALQASDVVCSVNWSANGLGTSLLTELRRRLGVEKTIFMDPADFRDRLRQYKALLRMAKKKKLFDWIALNEFEAIETSRLLGVGAKNPSAACAGISSEIGARVDVHTDRIACTSEGTGVVERKVKTSRARRLTGAGDVWDAASIFAHLRGMPDGRRLDFANAAAGLYVRREGPKPPTEDEVLSELG